MENKHTQQVDFSNPNADKITSGTTNKPLENKPITAVDWLEKELKDRYPLMNSEPFFEQAKQMEKEQIMQAVYDSMGLTFDPNMGRAELYYKEKYGI
jgi:hypothetical protein